MRKMVLIMIILAGLVMMEANAAEYPRAESARTNIELAYDNNLISAETRTNIIQLCYDVQESHKAKAEELKNCTSMEEVKEISLKYRKAYVWKYWKAYKETIEVLFKDHPEINWVIDPYLPADWAAEQM